MNTLVKKSVVVIICLTFLISAVGSSTAIIIKSKETAEEVPQQTETITLYRYGPDGSVTPIIVEFKIEDDQGYMDALIEKCQEILDDDVEIRNYFNSDDTNESNSSLKFGKKAFVISYGRGFHFKMKWRLSFLFINRLFSLSIPKIILKINRPWIFCNYGNDSKAKTIIRPNQLINHTQVINGSHSILLRNFVGLAMWSGRFQKSNIMPRLIIGKAKYVVTYQNQKN